MTKLSLKARIINVSICWKLPCEYKRIFISSGVLQYFVCLKKCVTSSSDLVSCMMPHFGEIISCIVEWFRLLGAFAKLRGATVSFVMCVWPSVGPSVRPPALGSHWTGFYELWYLSIPRKSVEKNEVPLKSEKSVLYVVVIILAE